MRWLSPKRIAPLLQPIRRCRAAHGAAAKRGRANNGWEAINQIVADTYVSGWSKNRRALQEREAQAA